MPLVCGIRGRNYTPDEELSCDNPIYRTSPCYDLHNSLVVGMRVKISCPESPPLDMTMPVNMSHEAQLPDHPASGVVTDSPTAGVAAPPIPSAETP